MCATSMSVVKPCRLAFDLKLEAHLRWTHDRFRVIWDGFVQYQRMANVKFYANYKFIFSLQDTIQESCRGWASV